MNNKVAIITLNGYYNYGNRLQNYALQEKIKELGFTVETIVVEDLQNNNPKPTLGIFSRIKKMTFTQVISKIRNKLDFFMNKKNNSLLISTRMERFKLFTIERIIEVKGKIIGDKVSNNLDKEYDFFVVGSDQVWNTNTPILRKIYFLSFAPHDKRIAYAPSFGVSKLPIDLKDEYFTYLKSMSSISVREYAGADIIRDLCNIDVPVLVDPTLLLSKDQWLKIAKPHAYKPTKKYVLSYFLGNKKRKNLKLIENYAHMNNLEIIHLNDFQDNTRFTVDPSEFVDYFHSADVIFTDSFHGSVFSIIFKKPFVVFSRGNMNSRIDTLLSKFHLEQRHWDYVGRHKNFNEVDFSQVDTILEKERKKSLNYLKEALVYKRAE